MTHQTAGIHHITAFVDRVQETVDYYASALGLRLVKQTINFDAPEVYHLYFGNEWGSPGTIITFFPSPGSQKGTIGGGQVGYTTYVVPEGTLDWWEARLKKFNIPITRMERFGEQYLRFPDLSGLQLEIVARAEGPASTWAFGGVPADKAIKGFGGAVLYSTDPVKTAMTLEQVLGLERVEMDGDYMRFKGAGDLGNLIDLDLTKHKWGQGGSGIVHHIAWRAKDDEDQLKYRELAATSGLQPTPVVDRQYFNAVYFREQGGILFEIATDPPGFAHDESVETMGAKLMLPAWYEQYRDQIIAGLEPFEVRVLEEDL
ncbi:MAG: ring-cleaving dioxygenase [Candidatus Cohnella colombiensis]|uniref:Ring-cleaving dioxygenase n=1 Tax=Candidatus Cohnella colombiensis TaxID=3121368 RepID=A0AA95JCK4_9BACL|nr:MAG: ring-cleaving dioxygenase [Cohnella sp.]